MKRPALPSYTWFLVILVVGLIALLSALALANRPKMALVKHGSCAKIQSLANLPSSDFPESLVL